jgi:hypothetical protein
MRRNQRTIEALYKHKSETKNTINKEISELRMKIDNIKEEKNSEYGKPQKKEWNRIEKQKGRPIQQNRTNRRQNLRNQR